MRTMLMALAIGWVTLPAHAGDLRDDVLQQLSGIEDPPTAESLGALGPTVPDELMELAQDDSVPRSKRARAVHALGWFPSDETRAFLANALDGEDKLMRRKAVYALGNGWGDAAMPLVEGALASDDVQLRIAAANTLANIDSDKALAALNKRLPLETEPAVKKSIEKALSR